ncbi:MAG: hypothetical protein AABW72_06205 [archaeon]
MLIEFLYHLMALDIAWIFGLIINNLQFLFIFIAIIFVFANGQKLIAGTIALILMLWILNDVGNIFQWATFVGGFLSIHYMVKIAVLAFAEDDPKLSSRLIWVNEISSYCVWIYYNFFMMGL